MRAICTICKFSYNCEDLAECIKCGCSVCAECVLFEDGKYYCEECMEKETKEVEDKPAIMQSNSE